MVEFAWASMAAELCIKTLYLLNRVLSEAISTSTIRPNAASIFDDCLAMLSVAKVNLDMVPPF